MRNPHSKACYSMVWMYSLEPPLYYMLNKACRNRIKALLPILGPFAKAISRVLGIAESGRKDKITMGRDMKQGGPLGTMSGSMLVFRGALLPITIIHEFQNQIGKRWTKEDNEKYSWLIIDSPGCIHLPGATSTSESFKVALDFARAPPSQSAASEQLHSVLFVICLHNYERFNGFRMNSAMFSAHPEEREILLMEGVAMYVLGMEEMYIDNFESTDAFWKNFNMKTVTVVYLYHYN